MTIDEIIAQVNTVKSLAGIAIDEAKLRQFLQSAINGDSLENAHAIDVKHPSGEMGVTIFILTNARIMRVRVSKAQVFESSEIYLKQVLAVNRMVSNDPGDSRSIVRIESQQGFFGLRYRTGSSGTEAFFSAVDAKVREVKKGS